MVDWLILKTQDSDSNATIVIKAFRQEIPLLIKHINYISLFQSFWQGMNRSGENPWMFALNRVDFVIVYLDKSLQNPNFGTKIRTLILFLIKN